jgi:hypothetical protein
VLKYETTNRENMPIKLNYNNEALHEETHIKFLGLEIDKFLNWKTRVKLMLPKACFALRNMKLCSNTETLRMIYHAYVHSLMRYEIVFWGNSPDAKKIFLLQKKTIRIMMGMKHRDTCRPVFTKLNILTLASQYILSMMIFMINNLGHFTFNCAIHNKSTRHRRNLHVLQSHLVMGQKGAHYMRVKFLTACLPI